MASKDLVFRFLALDSGAGREFDRMAGKASHLHGAFNALALGVAATGATVAGASIKMADNFEDAHNRLVSALLNTGQTVKGTQVPIAAAMKTLEGLGFNTAQTSDAMAKLELATKKPAKSIRDVAIAADIARGRNIDLATASDILVKVETGHVGLLGRLGLATKDATGHTITQRQAIRELVGLYGGDASRYTDTFKGKQAVLGAELTDMGTKLGLVLIPALLKTADVVEKDVVPKLETFGGWVSRNKTPIEDIAKVLGTIAAFKFASSKLNDVSRLLGLGSKGLGGAGGGVFGSAKPIPVYVTNMAGGFGGVGGKGVSGAERAGEGAAAEGVGARVAAKFGLQGASRLAGPLYYTYLATQGGDQNRAQLNAVRGGGASQSLADLIRSVVVRPGFDLAKASGAEKSDYAAAFRGGGGSTSVNAAAAVAFIQKYGSASQIAALQKLDNAITGTGKDSRTAAQIGAAAAGRMADAWGGASRAMVTQQRKADATFVADIRTIPGAVSAAKATGLSIGAALDAGITVGIRQGKSNIDVVSISVIDGVKSVMSKRADMRSPSKMTAYIGRMLAEGLGVGMKQGEAMVAKSGKSLIGTVQSSLGALLGSRTGMREGIASNLIQGGSLSNMPLASLTTGFGTSYTAAPTVAGMQAFLSGYAGRERTFGRNLALARKKGLSPLEAANIAQMGLDAGGPLAAALAGGSVAQNRSVSALTAQVTAAANQIGTAAAGANYDRQVALLEEVVQLLRAIPAATGHAVGSEMKTPHAAKTLSTAHLRARRAT